MWVTAYYTIMKQKHGEIQYYVCEHNNSREDTLKTWADMAAGIRRALSTDGEAHNNLTDAEKKTLGDHATWLESIPVKYADVNHWKIPYPETVLPMYVDPADQ